MNIFENHFKEIENLVLKNKSHLNLNSIDNLKSVSLEIPPSKFNFDLSCNIAMVLGKSNKLNPNALAQKLKKLFLDNIENFADIEIAGPGFINIKLSNSALIKNINFILENNKKYGSFKSNKTYNIEFVSANPTGPMHVGHCRGAILGDVIANVLLFNQHKVTKEYYVNDYGNQIINFTKSVYFRIREIAFNEKFPLDNEELYPGDYLIEFAKNILNSNHKIDFKNLNEITKGKIADISE